MAIRPRLVPGRSPNNRLSRRFPRKRGRPGKGPDRQSLAMPDCAAIAMRMSSTVYCGQQQEGYAMKDNPFKGATPERLARALLRPLRRTKKKDQEEEERPPLKRGKRESEPVVRFSLRSKND